MFQVIGFHRAPECAADLPGRCVARYALMIAALYVNNLLLKILGRSIAGFQRWQPANSAGGTDAADRDRNMGHIIIGVSFGFMGDPTILNSSVGV